MYRYFTSDSSREWDSSVQEEDPVKDFNAGLDLFSMQTMKIHHESMRHEGWGAEVP